MRGAGVTIMQERRKAVADDTVIDGGCEQSLLGVAWQFRPYFHGCVPEKNGDLIFIHLMSSNGWLDGVLAASGSGLPGRRRSKETNSAGWRGFRPPDVGFAC